MTPLPPTVTNTFGGVRAKPRRAAVSAAMAARSSGMPANGG